MAKDFEKGIKSGLSTLIEDPEWEVEFVNEFIAEGSKEKAEAAINKLVSFSNADLITGILSNRTAMGLADKIEKSKKSFLINNMGEHAPNPKILSSTMLLNSTNMWQQVWSMGHWGVKTFGPKGMFVGGVYDSGYSFTGMLSLGMRAADSEAVMPFSVAPVHKIGELADVSSVFQHIEQFEPDFIFAAFCGEEASMFLKEYRDRGLTVPLLGMPFLVQPFESNGKEVVVYTPVSSNTEITDQLNGIGEMADNPFPQLGYETGLLVKSALMNGDVKDLRKNLASARVESERGELDISTTEPGKHSKVYLVKNVTDGADTHKVLLRSVQTVEHNNEALVSLLDEPSSGWYNPYLGI